MSLLQPKPKVNFQDEAVLKLQKLYRLDDLRVGDWHKVMGIFRAMQNSEHFSTQDVDRMVQGVFKYYNAHATSSSEIAEFINDIKTHKYDKDKTS